MGPKQTNKISPGPVKVIQTPIQAKVRQIKAAPGPIQVILRPIKSEKDF